MANIRQRHRCASRRSTRHRARGQSDPPTAINVNTFARAFDLALNRGLEASDRIGQAPTPAVLTDALVRDPELRDVMLQLFGTDASLPSRTRWSSYLDALDALVYDTEPATRLESAKMARERFGFRFVRALAQDELKVVGELFGSAVPAIVKAPLFEETRPEFPNELVAAVVERRNERTMRMWHFLSAPLADCDEVWH
jgi:hypothetical protein